MEVTFGNFLQTLSLTTVPTPSNSMYDYLVAQKGFETGELVAKDSRVKFVVITGHQGNSGEAIAFTYAFLNKVAYEFINENYAVVNFFKRHLLL